MSDEYFEELMDLSEYRGTEPSQDLEGLIDFFSDTEALKYIKRYKPMESDEVKDSSAGHSWNLGVMGDIVYELLDLDLDREKIERISKYHDLAESITDDYDSLRIENEDGITQEEKTKEEEMAIKKIARKLSGNKGHVLVEIWRDYEQGRSEEARYVKAMDKMESMLHLAELQEFDDPDFIATYADEAVKDYSELEPVLQLVKEKLRESFEDMGIEWEEDYNYALR